MNKYILHFFKISQNIKNNSYVAKLRKMNYSIVVFYTGYKGNIFVSCTWYNKGTLYPIKCI